MLACLLKQRNQARLGVRCNLRLGVRCNLRLGVQCNLMGVANALRLCRRAFAFVDGSITMSVRKDLEPGTMYFGTPTWASVEMLLAASG